MPVQHCSDGPRTTAAAGFRGSKTGLYARLVGAFILLLSTLVVVTYALKPLADLHRDVQRRRLLCRLKSEVTIPFHHQRFLQENAKFKTCAVVASSGAVLSHRWGVDINEHDAVFRFNDAPVREFFRYVGTKETVRLMRGEASVEPYNHTELSNYSKHNRLDPNALYLYVGGPEIDNNTLEVFRKQQVPLSHVKALDESLLDDMGNVVRSLYSNKWSDKMHVKRHPNATFSPTTGFLGMVMALAMCDHVDAYDMTPSYASNQSFYHYYIRRGAQLFRARISKNSTAFISGDENSWHKTFSAERDLWARASTSSRELAATAGKTSYEGFSKLRCGSSAGAGELLLQI